MWSSHMVNSGRRSGCRQRAREDHLQKEVIVFVMLATGSWRQRHRDDIVRATCVGDQLQGVQRTGREPAWAHNTQR